MPIVAALLIAAFGIYKFLSPAKPTINPLAMQISKLTETGQARSGVVSPDGRWVAYVLRGAKQSLWVKQVATTSEAQVVAPESGYFYYSPMFSPDGNYIFYEHTDPVNDAVTDLFSVPSLGGTPQRVLVDVASAISFSPDGKQIAFIRDAVARKTSQIIITNSDGSGSRMLAESTSFSGNGGPPAWSGDGKWIAISSYDLDKESLSSVLVYGLDGLLQKSFAYPMLVPSVAWMPDSSGLFLQVQAPESRFRRQIKFQPYPSGDLQNVTNDLNEYYSLSVTADGKSLVAVQRQASLAVYVGDAPAKWPGDIKLKPAPVTSGQADGSWLKWTPDGKLLYVDGQYHSFSANPDGSSRTPILERETIALFPTPCGPGSIVISLLHDNKLNLYKYSMATGELKQLTFGRDGEGPACTPDGKALFYQDYSNVPSVLRVPTDGGSSQTVATNAFGGVQVSPDGKHVVYQQALGSGSDQKFQLVIQGIAATQPDKVLPSSASLQSYEWSPDGRGLVLNLSTGGGSKLFYQPLDRSRPTQITHFDSEPLFVATHAFSLDGKRVAITRARANVSDLVMFTNFR